MHQQLQTLRRRLARLTRDEAAVSATEYAVMLALIVLGSMAVISSVGNRMYDIYDVLNAALPS
jgi:Flp pilus assembly pilin Flp